MYYKAMGKPILARYPPATETAFHSLIDGLVHLEKLPCTHEDARRALTMIAEHETGFNDAVNLSIMERESTQGIHSFDKALDRIPRLSRRKS